MREDLLGYLLDALDDDERRRVEDALRKDPRLQEELEHLQENLALLGSAWLNVEPPADLSEQTCDLVEAVKERELVHRPDRATDPRSRRRIRAASPEVTARSRSWSASDSVVAAGIFVAVSMMFFPAIAGSRYRSEVTGCQQRLQELGIALADYSETTGGYFPSIPVRGNRSAAGLYGPILYEGGFITEPQLLVCPGSRMAHQSGELHIPSLSELDRATGPQLNALRRAMGGSYGYTLGYQRNGQYCTPRNKSRYYFALLSDSPSLHLPSGQSDNHAGRGQNVLFEDLHVQFLVNCGPAPIGDSLFRNRAGYVEAGLDEADSVIAPSFAKPLMEF
jgi:hypothetical protein